MHIQRGRKRPSPCSTQTTGGQQYKLCGFLHAALAVNHPSPELTPSLTGCECFFDGEAPVLRLGSDAGATLLPIHSSDDVICQENESPNPNNNSNSNYTGGDNGCKSSSGKKRRRLGLVKGSMSIVHQLQALVTNRRMQVKGLVVGISRPRRGELRAVVLFDVYLPLALWADPQVWKPGFTPAAVLSHL
ncbi:hypothetical protein KI387_042636, partial [Taxus chinensis]